MRYMAHTTSRRPPSDAEILLRYHQEAAERERGAPRRVAARLGCSHQHVRNVVARAEAKRAEPTLLPYEPCPGEAEARAAHRKAADAALLASLLTSTERQQTSTAAVEIMSAPVESSTSTDAERQYANWQPLRPLDLREVWQPAAYGAASCVPLALGLPPLMAYHDWRLGLALMLPCVPLLWLCVLTIGEWWEVR